MTYSVLSPREIRRYARQIMLPELGLPGQERLKNAKVLVIGAGGLGCPVLQYLAAAGVGKLGIAEFDLVDETNLQRQVLYGSDDLGKLKSVIAEKKIKQLNCLIETDVINLKIDRSNSLNILQDYDIIVDSTDNYSSRYLINDSCVILNKPMVHGAIYKFEGQVSVFNYMGGPTYRCYNQTQFSGSRNPLPSETGLLGVLPGITGILMANEVIKIITGTGNILSGKILVFNILYCQFNILSLALNPENLKITKLQDNY